MKRMPFLIVLAVLALTAAGAVVFFASRGLRGSYAGRARVNSPAGADPNGRPPPPPDRVVVFVDARGEAMGDVDAYVRFQPLAGAKVVDGPPTKLAAIGGFLSLPGNRKVDGSIDVISKTHGSARIDIDRSLSGNYAALPLVAADAPAHKRALQGRVLGPDGKPVRGAAVRCQYANTPGGGLFPSNGAAALTDADGRFVVYPADQNASSRFGAWDGFDPFVGGGLPEHGELVPVNSTYVIDVNGPAEEGYFPCEGRYFNTAPATIRLQRPARARTLKYESATGRFLDARALASLRLRYASPDGRQGCYLPARYRDGGKLLPGTYNADTDSIAYEPLEVTPDGPAELVFRAPAPITFGGRVIDGISGKPVAGAFIIGMTGSGQASLEDMTPAQWDAIEQLPLNPDHAGLALAPLRKVYAFPLIARSDDQGKFELVQKPGIGRIYGMVCFARDRLPAVKPLYDAKPNAEHRATIDDAALFPAARVTIHLKSPSDGIGYQASSAARWDVADDGQPDWYPRFKKAAEGGQRGWAIACSSIAANEKRTIYVPAGLTLRVAMNGYDADEWIPRDAGPPFLLNVGETKDLGDVGYDKALVLSVHVSDEAGGPVEGAPIRRLQDRNVWTVAHNTDAAGNATFYVRPNSSGRFSIIDLTEGGEQDRPANLTVAYRVGEKIEADRPLELRLTKSQVQTLYGETSAAEAR